MKKCKFSVLGMLAMALALGLALAGCASSPVGSQAPVDMVGTEWVFSTSAASSTYTFLDSATYKVEYTGAFEAHDVIASALAGDEYGTGTYSVSGRTVTLKPNGGLYLGVAKDGNISIELAESFTVKITDDSFVLGAVTYRKAN
jgi:hypothetical protein